MVSMQAWSLPDAIEFDKANTRPKPIIEQEDEKKKSFGMELGKGKQAFEAACSVCGDKTSEALYVSQNWLNDPIVVASKDLYLKTVHNSKDLLDADALAARLLQMADERNQSNTFYMLEGKDRIKCLELYAEIKGFTGKNAQTNNGLTIIKSMKVKLVRPDDKTPKIIDVLSDETTTSKSLVKLKLVS